jgi:hypothetical protein
MKPRPTEAEFEELKRKRDETIRASVLRICEEEGWDPAQTVFHASHADGCYCACPDGPCQHVWDGPNVEFDDGHGISATCSRCKMLAFSHDIRFAP